ncbi:uncharacterized protein tp53i13 [Aulostomus maculatus]
MSSQTTPPLTVTVLAALWVSLGRCSVIEFSGPRCDNGKLSLERDLPKDAVYWDCPVSTWPESTKRLPCIDTVYDAEPARQRCMDTSITYALNIPNSGAYRPVRAESGEYLYCPPQRWLNNLHHGATVLLYHPCAPLSERLLLSVLVRSCLPDYIMTPHPQLRRHTPIALVSWGRTLELSNLASSDVCDWLEATRATTRNPLRNVRQRNKYNLLLTRSAEPRGQKHTRQEAHSSEVKESFRQCCEHIVSSRLNAAVEVKLNSTTVEKNMSWEAKTRQRRAAIREKQGDVAEGNITAEVKQTIRVISKSENNDSSTHGPSADTAFSDPPGTRDASSLSENQDHSLTPQPTAPSGSNVSHRLKSLALSLKGDAHSTKPIMKEKDSAVDRRARGKMRNNEEVDIKEREVGEGHKHSDTHSRKHARPQSASDLPNTPVDCEGCRAGELCECTKGSGPEGQATLLSKGLPKTPRTDEAVWAAAALGFLLVLLTLSVLHTRLYRQWRTAPSLYWHDPRQDYDSVADIIRRRLRIAKRRRKRGRRQECVLLPSSSSSDEDL